MMSFASPWLLGFLALLPAIWWLLRVTPPAPKQITFPALMLMRDLLAPQQTPSHTPWWLLLLRLFIAALLILALAGPTLTPQNALDQSGPVVIAIDNDWASASDWDARQNVMHDLLAQAQRAERSVFLLATAPDANGQPLQLLGPMPAAAAQNLAATIKPQPWPSDWIEAKRLIDAANIAGDANLFWLNGGAGGTDADAFAATLNDTGTTKIYDDGKQRYLITPPREDSEVPALTLYRTQSANTETVSLVALDAAGENLAQFPVSFTATDNHATVKPELPPETRNRTARFEILGQHNAAATLLLDSSWQRHSIGLIGDKNAASDNSLLGDLFYVTRALKPFADLHTDSLNTLLAQKISVLILTDTTILGDDEIAALKTWIGKGGILLRFAGDHLAGGVYQAERDLISVTLRAGDRALGGALSWDKPQHLRAFSTSSPFRNLPLPPDVVVQKQILADPASDLPEHTWAQLEDGTPLVTARAIGQGTSILFHIPARAEWSNLPLSGLFVAMLRRIVDLASNAAPTQTTNLAPFRTMDAFGELQNPGNAARALEVSADHPAIGPQHPPGFYGDSQSAHAFNLGDALVAPQALGNDNAISYTQEKHELDLQAQLLIFAFLLLIADFIIGLWLRGLITLPQRSVTTITALLLALLLTASAHAATSEEPTPAELSGKTWLAYVITDNRSIDDVSAAGLAGLAHQLQRRTSLDAIGVIGIDPAGDELAFFPLLYWPLRGAAPPPSPATITRVQEYLRHGGLILFDGDERETALALNLPPLMPLPPKHVLKHSFYLLDELPGRFSKDEVWIEASAAQTGNNVASVITGSNDWAAAWATDEQGAPQFACVPGGEAQREVAIRFGINLVMYALTGTYKDDQMHVRALLDKAGPGVGHE